MLLPTHHGVDPGAERNGRVVSSQAKELHRTSRFIDGADRHACTRRAQLLHLLAHRGNKSGQATRVLHRRNLSAHPLQAALHRQVPELPLQLRIGLLQVGRPPAHPVLQFRGQLAQLTHRLLEAGRHPIEGVGQHRGLVA